jgi:hypothetical protein
LGLELDPHVAEHAVPAGLLLVAAVDLGLAADVSLYGTFGVWVAIAGPELALEPFDDDRGVGLAHGYQDLLAGGRPLERTVGSSSSMRASAGPILSRSCFGRARSRPPATAPGTRGSAAERLLLARQRVAGLGHGQLGDRSDLAGLQLADGLLLLAVQQQQLADPLVLVAGACSRRAPASGACPDRTRR